MRIINFCGIIALLFPFSVFAGRVRILPTSSQEMPVIHLMTGRSTVLRFSSPPKKVIIGNQNYFNIEFIDSDVTLQSLAHTTSNIFVYGEGFTYGFILKVDHSSDYDDLVFIKNKIPFFALPSTEKAGMKNLELKKDLTFSIITPKTASFELQGGVFKWNESIQSFYADLFLRTKNQKVISADSTKIQILSGDQDITTIKAVFEKDQFMQNIENRIRIFAKVNLKQFLKLKIQINNEEILCDLKWKK